MKGSEKILTECNKIYGGLKDGSFEACLQNSKYYEIKKLEEQKEVKKINAGNFTLNFGKYKGETLCDVDITDPGYLDWLENNSESQYLLNAIREYRG